MQSFLSQGDRQGREETDMQTVRHRTQSHVRETENKERDKEREREVRSQRQEERETDYKKEGGGERNKKEEKKENMKMTAMTGNEGKTTLKAGLGRPHCSLLPQGPPP